MILAWVARDKVADAVGALEVVERVGLEPNWIPKLDAEQLSPAERTRHGTFFNEVGLRYAQRNRYATAIEFLEEEMQDEHGIEIKIPVDVEGAKYFHVPPSGDVLVNPEATMGLAKVFHVLGMADQWTMSSKCFDGANYGLFTGNDGDMKTDNKLYVEEAKHLGCEVMLMGECGHAYRI